MTDQELKEYHRKCDESLKARNKKILDDRLSKLKAKIVKSVSFDPNRGKWYYQIFNMSRPDRGEHFQTYTIAWESNNWFENRYFDTEQQARDSCQKMFEFYIVTCWDRHKLGEE